MSKGTKMADYSTPAGRLILPVDPDQTAWLQTRRTGLGGTDAATIVGANKFATLFGTWQDKTSTDTPVDETNDLFWFGHSLEPILAARFEAETGISTRRVGTLRSTEHPHMIANIDRLTGDGGALEIKTTEWFTSSGKEWTGGEIPEHPWWQMQHCLAVSGRSHGWFAALVGRRFVIAGPVDRDEAAIATLVAAELAFWEQHVVTGVAPAIDPATFDEDEARARFTTVDPATAVDIADQPVPEAWLDTLNVFLAARAAEADAKKVKESAKAELMSLLGAREFLTVGGVPAVRWAQTSGARYFDQDEAVRLLAAAQGLTEFEVKAALTKKRPDGRTFTVVGKTITKGLAA
jgi:putative phage-type endonuclease